MKTEFTQAQVQAQAQAQVQAPVQAQVQPQAQMDDRSGDPRVKGDKDENNDTPATRSSATTNTNAEGVSAQFQIRSVPTDEDDVYW